MEVGVRELKAKLSEYIGSAAAGDSVIITDRGKPVARLVGLDETIPLERGVDEGWIEPPRRHSLGPATRYQAAKSVMTALDEERGS